MGIKKRNDVRLRLNDVLTFVRNDAMFAVIVPKGTHH